MNDHIATILIVLITLSPAIIITFLGDKYFKKKFKDFLIKEESLPKEFIKKISIPIKNLKVSTFYTKEGIYQSNINSLGPNTYLFIRWEEIIDAEKIKAPIKFYWNYSIILKLSKNGKKRKLSILALDDKEYEIINEHIN